MSLSSDVLQKLMAYADGELEPGDLPEVEHLLATNPDAGRFVEQVGGLGERVRVLHARDASAVGRVDLTDAVMAKVAPAATVTPLDEARKRRAARWKLGAGVAAIAAAAAAVLVATRSTEAPLAQGEAPAASAPAGPGVEVSAVESSGQSVSVFYLPNKNELSTSVVVWVDETGEK